MMTPGQIGRFTDSVSFLHRNGCFEWQGAKQEKGYGILSVGKKSMLAHRFAYEMCFGPIPAGFHIHHMCRNTACVNPSHLVAMPAEEHGQVPRFYKVAHPNALKTYCPKGHPYDEANTGRNSRGQRYCRQCAREKQQEFRDRTRKVREPKKVCVNGHPLVGDNVKLNKQGSRVCQQCNRDRARAAYHVRKGRPVPPRRDRDYCINGHLKDEANTYVTKKGQRVCKECRRASVRESQRRHRQRLKEEKPDD